jgi:DNA-binding SARP family transcriptional activator
VTVTHHEGPLPAHRPPISTDPSGGLVPRPRLTAILDDAAHRRLIAVIGGAGYGKSSLVAAWLAATDTAVAWCALAPDDHAPGVLVTDVVTALAGQIGEAPPDLAAAADGATSDADDVALARAEGLAARTCGWIHDWATSPPTDDRERPATVSLVLDDLHQLDGSPAAIRFVEALVRGAPPSLRIVVTSALRIPFPVERLRANGHVLELAAERLAFDVAETTELLARNGIAAPELATDVLAVTGGWPALTRLLVEALRDLPSEDIGRALAQRGDPSGRLLAYIAEEVLTREDPATLDLLRVASRFDHISGDLLEALGVPDAERTLTALVRRALFVKPGQDAGGGTYAVHGLIRDVVNERWPATDADVADLHRRAAAWYVATGRPADALRVLAATDQAERIAETLADHAFEVIRAGDFDAVVDAVRALPESLRSPTIELALGDALLRRGDWDAALLALDRAAGGGPPTEPAIAWRMGLIQHERGDVDRALATFDGADLERGAPADQALVVCWKTIALWQRQDTDLIRPVVERAIGIARESGDIGAIAVASAAEAALAHLERDMHRAIQGMRHAAEAADRSGDVLLQVRLRTDLGYLLDFEGRYIEGLAEHEAAVRTAGTIGHGTLLGLALTDRGQVNLWLGNMDESASDLAAAEAVYRRHGSLWSSYATVRRADLQRIRRETTAARRGYQQVLDETATLGDTWFRVDAIVGLAATLVHEAPDEAMALIAEAMDDRLPIDAPFTIVSAARVAYAAHDHDRARTLCEMAMRRAAELRARPTTAGALEVLALMETEPSRARALADEALGLWDQIGSPFGIAWNAWVQAKVRGGPEGAEHARRAAQAFDAMGARALADEVGLLAERLEAGAAPPVEIRALGAFRVIRDGEPVPLVEWQSRKARDLLRILVARRGRPITRVALADLLWPDEDPGPLANRLSGLLATIRSVLDPDRVHPQDHFVQADKVSVALDGEHLSIDLEAFLDKAERGRELLERGRRDRGLAEYAAAESLYGGPFLDEDGDADWAAAVRDQARAAYLAIARTLAAARIEAGDADGAVRYYLRILEDDPYDEDVHIGLVRALSAAGRHGEARRRYGVYAARMAEIALEPAAFPAGAATR